jgi:GNAT superfamily N-acetyltransferase
MESETRGIADEAIVRPATEGDLDGLVQDLWAVASEGRWIGTEVPFDRQARRDRLALISSGELSALFVADTSSEGGPGVVGHISIDIAPYGVADIGMLVIDGWRGMGLGTRMLNVAIETDRPIPHGRERSAFDCYLRGADAHRPGVRAR